MLKLIRMHIANPVDEDENSFQEEAAVVGRDESPAMIVDGTNFFELLSFRGIWQLCLRKDSPMRCGSCYRFLTHFGGSL